VVALPAGSAFSGVKAVSKAGKRPVFFVTAGERGRLRIWRCGPLLYLAKCGRPGAAVCYIARS